MTFDEWAAQNNLEPGTEVHTWAEAAWSWGRQEMLRETNQGVQLAHSDAYNQGRRELVDELLQYDEPTQVAVLRVEKERIEKDEKTVVDSVMEDAKENSGKGRGGRPFDDEPPRAE